ncbi:AAC(3) family N-acetyltransferase [Planktomarina temperata]|nr:AAC(3) family N-acetyltransferase [Planktomarina temperata]
MLKNVDVERLKNLSEASSLLDADAIIIHGDAIIANSYLQRCGSTSECVECFLSDLLSSLHPKTFVFFPSFTYNFTKTNVFDVQRSQSEIGLLSKSFMSNFSKLRTIDPIFSHCCNKSDDDMFTKFFTSAFGNDSFYCYILKRFTNVKILNLGCTFERNTFCHYIEERGSVPYRFDKEFKGSILNNDQLSPINYTFFCRNLSYNFSSNFHLLKERADNLKSTFQDNFNRVCFNVYDANDLLTTGLDLISDDKFALVQEN